MTESVIVRMPTSLAGGRARLLLCGDAEVWTHRVRAVQPPTRRARRPPPALCTASRKTAIEHYRRGRARG